MQAYAFTSNYLFTLLTLEDPQRPCRLNTIYGYKLRKKTILAANLLNEMFLNTDVL